MTLFLPFTYFIFGPRACSANPGILAVGGNLHSPVIVALTKTARDGFRNPSYAIRHSNRLMQWRQCLSASGSLHLFFPIPPRASDPIREGAPNPGAQRPRTPLYYESIGQGSQILVPSSRRPAYSSRTYLPPVPVGSFVAPSVGMWAPGQDDARRVGRSPSVANIGSQNATSVSKATNIAFHSFG
jgi:hypothetical protein